MGQFVVAILLIFSSFSLSAMQGGEVVSHKEFPRFVDIISKNTNCGGFLPNNQQVITALHCVKMLIPGDKIQIRHWKMESKSGLYSPLFKSQKASSYKIKKITVNPRTKLGIGDIALVELDYPIKQEVRSAKDLLHMGPQYQRIFSFLSLNQMIGKDSILVPLKIKPLGISDFDRSLSFKGKEVVVVGRGMDNEVDNVESRELKVGIFKFKKYSFSRLSDMPLVEFSSKNRGGAKLCHGDSGSPVFTYYETEKGAQYRLLGVASEASTDDVSENRTAKSFCKKANGVFRMAPLIDLEWLHWELKRDVLGSSY